MKNITQIILVFLITLSCYAQQEKGIVGENNWLNNWTQFKSNKIDYGEPTQILAGTISENETLKKGEIYLLLGSVFVAPNITLTIEPGSVILGDYKTNGSLTISKGAKILAEGKSTDPIIFTSNRSVKRAGDWGGLILLGDAPINRYGSGSVASFYPNLSPADYANTNYGGDEILGSSGILRYVRVEYAGKRISQDKYFNGLLLASVGAATEIDHVMISNSGEDGFEVWGGNVSLSNTVSYKSKGTDFKFNYGTASIISNSLAIRSPYVSNGSGDRCLEVLSYYKKEEIDFEKSKTTIEATNLTFLNSSKDLEADIKMNLVHEAIYVGVDAELNMSKSVISGFNPAVVLDENIHVNQNNLEKIGLKEMYFNNCNGNIFVENNANNDDLENWYGNRAFFNVYSKSNNTETFIAADNYKRPDYRLRINKIIASNIDRESLDD
ncbi:hypothetical protein EYD46_15935 [Hyunsoonleella pacifica]|uniref:T9SS C-terminal target domain-containing protein n=2 Tax=Hyunsoonleella pacifica TaxID=1080224 RepID=A0A4Q9FJU4_9FLAO|nr:hypothetical protein EYD46_15935 [Hyunsoonleella pacifica]GGD28011.1 hypothetical protein GCM10011368_32550 [Hyunsoonleella pacifica]